MVNTSKINMRVPVIMQPDGDKQKPLKMIERGDLKNDVAVRC